MNDGTAATAEPTTPRGISWAYRVTSGVAIIGITAGTFASTVITNDYGGVQLGAFVTAVWIVLLVAGRLLVAPFLPLVIRTFGARRTFLTVKIAAAVAWIALGVLLAGGVVGPLSLYATAPIFGALSVFASTLTTLYSGAYISGHEMSGALTRMAVVRGSAVAVGALVGAIVIVTLGPAWGLAARGLLEIPLVIVLLAYRPAEDPPAPEAKRPVSAEMRKDLSTNPVLRRLVILGVGLTIFAGPFSELLVPITAALRQSDVVTGAALLIASIALGQVFSVQPVAALQARFTAMQGSGLMGGLRGACLVLYGIAAFLFSGGFELAVWAVIGLAFGMSRAASGALMVGAAVKTVPKENSSRAIVAFSFACTLSSPIGLLLWGSLVSFVSVEAAIIIGALGALAVSAYVFRRGDLRPATA
ncbi:MAG: hypothetical protein ACKOT0_12800 [bacterium]